MKSYCYITKKKGGMYIDCSYDPDFLEVLKSSVPAHSRKYDPETKQWWVAEKYVRQAERDCNTFYENVIEC
jgi:hypothetical protein